MAVVIATAIAVTTETRCDKNRCPTKEYLLLLFFIGKCLSNGEFEALKVRVRHLVVVAAAVSMLAVLADIAVCVG